MFFLKYSPLGFDLCSSEKICSLADKTKIKDTAYNLDMSTMCSSYSLNKISQKTDIIKTEPDNLHQEMCDDYILLLFYFDNIKVGDSQLSIHQR